MFLPFLSGFFNIINPRKQALAMLRHLVENHEFAEVDNPEKTITKLNRWHEVDYINMVIARESGGRQQYVTDFDYALTSDSGLVNLGQVSLTNITFTLQMPVIDTVVMAGYSDQNIGLDDFSRLFARRKDTVNNVDFLGSFTGKAFIPVSLPEFEGLYDVSGYNTPEANIQFLFQGEVLHRFTDMSKHGPEPYAIVIASDTLSVTYQRITSEKTLWLAIMLMEKLVQVLIDRERHWGTT